MNRNRLEKLLEFIAKQPDDPFLKYAIATEYIKNNDIDSGLRYYEDLVHNHENYVGTYYHLGKLYESLNRKEDAIETYRKGMAVARNIRDNHALAELQAVYNSAMGMDFDDD